MTLISINSFLIFLKIIVLLVVSKLNLHKAHNVIYFYCIIFINIYIIGIFIKEKKFKQNLNLYIRILSAESYIRGRPGRLETTSDFAERQSFQRSSINHDIATLLNSEAKRLLLCKYCVRPWSEL